MASLQGGLILETVRSLVKIPLSQLKDIQGRDGISASGYAELKAALPQTRIVYP